jgi:hypothetical protein
MDTLIDWLNVRTFAAIGGIVLLILAADRYGGYPRLWYDRWLHPPVGAAVVDGDIAQELERQKSLRLHSLYQRVSREIADAQAQGLDVGTLQAAADETLLFDKPRYRAAAIDRLNKLRLLIPRRPERIRAASAEEAADDEIPTPKAASARRR